MEMGSFAQQTHPAQWSVLGLLLLVNIYGLLLVNRLKQRGSICNHTWATKRNSYWAYMIIAAALVCCLDRNFEISEAFLCIRTYAIVFPLGLVDFYFSECQRVDMKVVAGAILWCLTMYLRVSTVSSLIGPGKIAILLDFSTTSLMKEVVRFMIVLMGVGFLGDLIFSPLHRLEHHRLTYASHHKVHHEFTNKLTALVLYHGTLLDDFLMPMTTAIGAVIFAELIHWSGFQVYGSSNLSELLMLFNTMFAHAHDVRCANLMFPLPNYLNFSAYHQVHHLNPGKNFGLTLPSDLIWDKLLGVQTATDPALLAEMEDTPKKPE